MNKNSMNNCRQEGKKEESKLNQHEQNINKKKLIKKNCD
jgi:hypothetical protein